MYKTIITAFAIIITAASCKKQMGVDAPTISISIDPSSSTAATKMIGDTVVYNLGDTTKFRFDNWLYTTNVAVYTGDPTHNYDLAGRSQQLGTVTLSFTSAAQYGTQTNTLQLLATNKLPRLDSASIVNAGWADISNRAALATSATAVASGTINLTDLVANAGDSLFLALKYTGATGSTQRTWTITNWTVNNVLPDVTYNLSTLANDISYWTTVRVAPASAGKWIPAAAQLQITGGAATAPDNTGWIVSKPLYVGRVMPDVSYPLISINGFTNGATAAGYTYKYAAKGTYKIVFEVFNHTLKQEKKLFRVFYVKVV